MKPAVITMLSLLAVVFQSEAQTRKTPEELRSIASAISTEANLLYNLERASWLGTDLFIKHFKGDDNRVDGYFSYPDLMGYTCVFYSGTKDPIALGTIHFGKDPDPNNAVAYTDERPLIEEERVYHQMRCSTLDLLRSSDSISVPKGVSLNIVPVIAGGERKVYLLPATSAEGVLMLGSDYIIYFDEKLNITNADRLHNRLLEFHAESHEAVSTHTHISERSPFMTATDLCSLMLYRKATGINRHKVISKDYVSYWEGGNSITIDYAGPEDVVAED